MKKIITKKAQSRFENKTHWSLKEVQETCQTIRQMLDSSEARCSMLLNENALDDYNELSSGIMGVHDELSNLQDDPSAYQEEPDNEQALDADHMRDRKKDEVAEQEWEIRQQRMEQ